MLDDNCGDISYVSNSFEQFEEEHLQDPHAAEDLRDEATKRKNDPQYIQQCYWATRRAIRKYRAAKDRFNPRKGRRVKHFKRKFHVGGLRPGQCWPKPGFSVGKALVSLDQASEANADA